jgi:hypothetical protein
LRQKLAIAFGFATHRETPIQLGRFSIASCGLRRFWVFVGFGFDVCLKALLAIFGISLVYY